MQGRANFDVFDVWSYLHDAVEYYRCKGIDIIHTIDVGNITGVSGISHELKKFDVLQTHLSFVYLSTVFQLGDANALFRLI